MGMSRCYSLMKCLLIIFNIIFLVVGVGGVGFAGWALWDGRASESAAGRAGLCALCAWGGVLGAGALCALCGAVRHSASLLAGAFALLALSGVAEGAAAWWGGAHLPQLRAALAHSLHRAVLHEYGQVASRTLALDAIQRGLACCGADGARDWRTSRWARADGDPLPLDLSVSAPPAFYSVPASCCVSSEVAECEASRLVPVSGGAEGAAGVHAAGCGARVLAALERAARVPLAAGAALLAMHALALLLALALCLRTHPQRDYKA